MAWTTPGTAVAGDVLTAAFWNSNVRDNMNDIRLISANIKSATLTNITTTVTSTASFADISGLSVTITPTSSTSLVLVSFTVWVGAASGQDFLLNLVRGSTSIGAGSGATGTNSIGMIGMSAYGTSPGNTMVCMSNQFLDNPATTSSTTYKLQGKVTGGTNYINRRNGDAAYSASSTITVMEVPV